MKRWTVMLIPHGQGTTRTLSVCGAHMWLVVALIAGLAFMSTFMYQRYLSASHHASRLLEQCETLQQLSVAPSTPAPVAHVADEGLSAAQRAEIERSIRAEYEKRDAEIVKQLSDIYDLEAQLREIHKLPPKTTGTTGYIQRNSSGGKGGPLGSGPASEAEAARERLRPPHVIYGLTHPSADLIIREADVRMASLRNLMDAMDAQRERVERTPTGWPTRDRRRELSSLFGNRRDPFTRALRHHDGLDITAPYGTSVMCTAAGKVVKSGYDGEYGNMVIIDHGNGTETLYAHMAKRLVKTGDEVNRGDTIGTLGSTGRSTGPHIHYEVRVRGRAVDPEPYIGN